MADRWLRGSFDTLEAPQKQGALQKKSSSWPHKWKKRFCVVSSSGEFMLFKSEENALKREGISARIRLSNSIASYGPKDGEIKLNYCNDISKPIDTIPEEEQCSLLLKAYSQSDRDEWLQLLQKAIIISKHIASDNPSTFEDLPPPQHQSFLDKARKRMSFVSLSTSTTTTTQQQMLSQNGNNNGMNPFRRLSVYLTGKGKTTPSSPLHLPVTPEKSNNNNNARHAENRRSKRKSVMLFLHETLNGSSKENTSSQKPLSLVEQYYLEEERKERERRRQTNSNMNASSSSSSSSTDNSQQTSNNRISGISVEVLDQINSMEALQKLILEADEVEKRNSVPSNPSDKGKAATIATTTTTTTITTSTQPQQQEQQEQNNESSSSSSNVHHQTTTRNNAKQATTTTTTTENDLTLSDEDITELSDDSLRVSVNEHSAPTKQSSLLSMKSSNDSIDDFVIVE